MGFSPGEFMSGGYPEQCVHWEAKDNYVMLWNADESKALLMLTYEEARLCLQQLNTAIYAVTGESLTK